MNDRQVQTMPSRPTPGQPTLNNAEIADQVWQLLEDATSARTPFTAMQLATVAADLAPRTRTILLRKAFATTGTLEFITDRRSDKLPEIHRNPRVALSGYDPEGLQQLRLEGRAAEVRDAARRHDFWDALKPHTHILFRSELHPGTPIPVPESAGTGGPPSPEDPCAIDENFALIEIRVSRMDWLCLASSPHLRYRAARVNNAWEGSWLVP